MSRHASFFISTVGDGLAIQGSLGFLFSSVLTLQFASDGADVLKTYRLLSLFISSHLFQMKVFSNKCLFCRSLLLYWLETTLSNRKVFGKWSLQHCPLNGNGPFCTTASVCVALSVSSVCDDIIPMHAENGMEARLMNVKEVGIQMTLVLCPGIQWRQVDSAMDLPSFLRFPLFQICLCSLLKERNS